MESSRYAIYEAIGRKVRVSGHGQKSFTCTVQDVGRDIFTGEIVVSCKGKTLRFKEPDRMVAAGKVVRLEYGDKDRHHTEDDSVMLGLAQEAVYSGTSLEEYLHETRGCPERVVEIRFLD